jgi:N-acetylglucosaminyl-diphospho-decaprenol L-rhamnosyltransferase
VTNTASEDLARPLLAGIVVHWHGDDDLLELLASWPEDRRFELLVIDNSKSLGGRVPGARIFEPSRNLGFGGAVNAALAQVEAPTVLILNPDARPTPGALDSLLEGLESHPRAAGLAPRLVSPDGRSQHRWQLRTLPTACTLLLQSLMLPAGRGPEEEPPSGSVVEQPAAAALVLRRGALDRIGGFDEAFFPAWFEDVDLARRLRDSDHRVVYWPAATFEHRLGSTVPEAGYGPFLWVYYRNLERYLRKHHSPALAMLSRLLVATAAGMRIPLLVLRKPKRAASRSEALVGLIGLLGGALSGWRLPAACVGAVFEERPAEERGADA